MLALFSIMLLNNAVAQNTYWQQKINYNMNVKMDVENNKYTAETEITYYNNSPDNLHKVYFHLYYNAFQPGSEMDVRQQNLPDPDGRIGTRISKLTDDEIGYQKIIELKQNNKSVKWKVEGTILEVTLNKAIKPGGKATFSLKNEAQIPLQIRRTGRDNKEGVKLSMTQWYPKMAEYDNEGWHINPYIAREFFGVYGKFDVTIDIDSKYTIGGTGILQNPKEIGHGYSATKSKKSRLKWHFVADNVHDFAWGADADYIHDIVKLNDKTDFHFLYKKGNEKRTKNWKVLEEKMVLAFKFMNKNFGEYPYKQFSFVQGGDGGMEYPMSTLILGNGADIKGLVGLAVHESMHSWYYGVLGMNEQKYSWMDEGFTSWAEDLTMNYLFGKEGANPFEKAYEGYYRLQKSGKEEAMSTGADLYNSNYAYGRASYTKGSIFLAQLEYIIGTENMKTTMLNFFDKWKFKHPNPNDFKRVAEKVSGIQLQWYLDKWIYTTQHIDYAIKLVSTADNNTKINIEKLGDIPMPIDITMILKNGKKVKYYIPLRIMRGVKPTTNTIVQKAWPWVYPKYSFTINYNINDIEIIGIDVENGMTDIDKSNNYYPVKEFVFE